MMETLDQHMEQINATIKLMVEEQKVLLEKINEGAGYDWKVTEEMIDDRNDIIVTKKAKHQVRISVDMINADLYIIKVMSHHERIPTSRFPKRNDGSFNYKGILAAINTKLERMVDEELQIQRDEENLERNKIIVEHIQDMVDIHPDLI